MLGGDDRKEPIEGPALKALEVEGGVFEARCLGGGDDRLSLGEGMRQFFLAHFDTRHFEVVPHDPLLTGFRRKCPPRSPQVLVPQRALTPKRLRQRRLWARFQFQTRSLERFSSNRIVGPKGDSATPR